MPVLSPTRYSIAITAQDTKEWIEEREQNSTTPKLFGWDTEGKNLALSTFGNEDRVLLMLTQEAAAEGASDFLSDPTILKVGVAIENDVKKFYQCTGILVKGWVDVAIVVNREVDASTLSLGGRLEWQTSKFSLRDLGYKCTMVWKKDDMNYDCFDLGCLNWTREALEYAILDPRLSYEIGAYLLRCGLLDSRDDPEIINRAIGTLLIADCNSTNIPSLSCSQNAIERIKNKIGQRDLNLGFTKNALVYVPAPSPIYKYISKDLIKRLRFCTSERADLRNKALHHLLKVETDLVSLMVIDKSAAVKILQFYANTFSVLHSPDRFLITPTNAEYHRLVPAFTLTEGSIAGYFSGLLSHLSYVNGKLVELDDDSHAFTYIAFDIARLAYQVVLDGEEEQRAREVVEEELAKFKLLLVESSKPSLIWDAPVEITSAIGSVRGENIEYEGVVVHVKAATDDV